MGSRYLKYVSNSLSFDSLSKFSVWQWGYYQLTYGDGEGEYVKLRPRDLPKLSQCIDSFRRDGNEASFIREDGATVTVKNSEQKPGKIVIERKDGSWGRYTAEELVALRNDLSETVASIERAELERWKSDLFHGRSTTLDELRPRPTILEQDLMRRTDPAALHDPYRTYLRSKYGPRYW